MTITDLSLFAEIKKLREEVESLRKAVPPCLKCEAEKKYNREYMKRYRKKK